MKADQVKRRRPCGEAPSGSLYRCPASNRAAISSFARRRVYFALFNLYYALCSYKRPHFPQDPSWGVSGYRYGNVWAFSGTRNSKQEIS